MTHPTRDKKGTCLKLAKLALDEINKEFGDRLEVRAVIGYDPRFFTPENQGKHNYLVVGSGKEALVVDPSFKYVAPLNDSGYKPIEDLTDFSLLYQMDLVLRPDDAIPLLVNNRGELVRLSFEVKQDSIKFVIFTTEKDGKDHLNYSCGKKISTGEFIPDEVRPQHALEEKVIDLVRNSIIV